MTQRSAQIELMPRLDSSASRRHASFVHDALPDAGGVRERRGSAAAGGQGLTTRQTAVARRLTRPAGSTPRCSLRGLGNLAAGVSSERVPRVEPQRGRAVVETEGNPLVIVLLDRPAKSIAVELFRPVQVSTKRCRPTRSGSRCSWCSDRWLRRAAPPPSARARRRRAAFRARPPQACGPRSWPTSRRRPGASSWSRCGVAGRARAAQPALVNGAVGLVWAPRGRPQLVFGLTITRGKIVGIDVIAD